MAERGIALMAEFNQLFTCDEETAPVLPPGCGCGATPEGLSRYQECLPGDEERIWQCRFRGWHVHRQFGRRIDVGRHLRMLSDYCFLHFFTVIVLHVIERLGRVPREKNTSFQFSDVISDQVNTRSEQDGMDYDPPTRIVVSLEMLHANNANNNTNGNTP